MKNNLYYLVFLLPMACTNPNEAKIVLPEQKDSNKVESSNVSVDAKRELMQKAIYYGDTVAFKKITNEYYFHAPQYEFVYPAIIMANKYNKKEGCFFAYLTLTNPIGGVVDKKTECLAFYYLLRAYEMKHSNAVEVVKERFGTQKIPSSSSYLVEMSKLD